MSGRQPLTSQLGGAHLGTCHPQLCGHLLCEDGAWIQGLDCEWGDGGKGGEGELLLGSGSPPPSHILSCVTVQGLHGPHGLRGAAAAAAGRQEDVQGRGGAAEAEVSGGGGLGPIPARLLPEPPPPKSQASPVSPQPGPPQREPSSQGGLVGHIYSQEGPGP